MADDQTAAPSSGSPKKGPGKNGQVFGRDKLARLVVRGSFLTIGLLVMAMIILSQAGAEGATSLAERTFTTILPVLAGWVGTVLAFYFSAQSLETTTDALTKAIGKGPSSPAPTVADTMIPMASIKGVIELVTTPMSESRPHGETRPEDLKLEDLNRKFTDLTISRLMFVEKHIFKYVMHQSTLNAFRVKNEQDGTFKRLLDDAEALVQISKLVVFVKPSATLTEARDALGAVAGAQDIIVTTTGLASGTMLGWLTNVDLTKSMAG